MSRIALAGLVGLLTDNVSQGDDVIARAARRSAAGHRPARQGSDAINRTAGDAPQTRLVSLFPALTPEGFRLRAGRLGADHRTEPGC